MKKIIYRLENLVKEENEKILIPRRSPEERQKNYNVATQRKIQQYIKGSSKRNLYLNDTPITSLPDNLKVRGSLLLTGTKITSLPKDLKVRGSLYLSGTGITSLPEGLEVGGTLDLRYSKIISLPKDLKVGGSLYLSRTKITSLPKDLKVGGNLELYDTGLSKTHTEDQIKNMCPGIKGEIKI